MLPTDFRQPNIDSATGFNDTTQAILSAIPIGLHKFLKPKNSSQGNVFAITTRYCCAVY